MVIYTSIAGKGLRLIHHTDQWTAAVNTTRSILFPDYRHINIPLCLLVIIPGNSLPKELSVIYIKYMMDLCIEPRSLYESKGAWWRSTLPAIHCSCWMVQYINLMGGMRRWYELWFTLSWDFLSSTDSLKPFIGAVVFSSCFHPCYCFVFCKHTVFAAIFLCCGLVQADRGATLCPGLT